MHKGTLQPSSGEAAVARARVKKLASPVAMATPVLKIATFHSSSLGGLVASLPALVSLRDSFPGARICCFARTPHLPLLQNFRAVDEVHSRPGGGISSQAALMARLHGSGYDLAVSFSQGSNALLLMWATGAPIRAGFVPSRMEALLTHKTRRGKAARDLEAIELVRAVGATPRGEKAGDFLAISPEIVSRAEKMRSEAGIEGKYLLVCPERRRRDEETGSKLGVDAATLRTLAARWPIVIVGLKNSSLIQEAGSTPHPIADLSGQTDVLTLASLCEASCGIFGVGNGPLELGRLWGKPVIRADQKDATQRALQTFGF